MEHDGTFMEDAVPICILAGADFFPLAHGDPTCIHLLVFSSRLKPPNSFPNGVCVSVEYMGMLLENVGDSPPQHKAEKALSQVISHLSRL